MTHKPTYYEILNLPPALQNAPSIPVQTLRSAYRRALLRNHPDKCVDAGSGGLGGKRERGNGDIGGKEKGEVFSIDQIAEALAVLSDGKMRGEYDWELKLKNGGGDFGGGNGDGRRGFKTGVEMVDLDDLETEVGADGGQVWWRACRCGDERGFVVLERELEEAAGEGDAEVGVGCRGCSLWLRVGFGVLEVGEVEGLENGIEEKEEDKG